MSFEWGYTNENGPHTWAKHFPCASGPRQSPILINTSVAIHDELLEKNPLKIELDDDCLPEIKNTGSGFQVAVENEKLRLSGGPLDPEDTYRMAQFHFHWGSKNDWGSEHLMDGQAFASEMHMVFWNTTKFSSIADAIKDPNGLAVLGSFVQAGDENLSMEPVIHELENISIKGSQTSLKNQIKLCSLLPRDTEKYFTYKGSLTTPPCSESVTWIVFKDPVSISANQLNAFRSIRKGDEHSENIVDNFRPPVPLGSRMLNCSFK